MNEKLELQVSFDEAFGSFAIIGYEDQKKRFVDFVNALVVKPITNDIERKSYRLNRVSINKVKDKIKSQRIATTKLVGNQFKEIETMLEEKANEYDRAIKEYDASKAEPSEEIIVGKELTQTLIIKGGEALLTQVLEYAKSLGLQGEIK